MDLPVTWLHLSDIHLCKNKTGWSANRVLDALLADFKRLSNTGVLQPDLIFVTGDLAYGHISEMKLEDQYNDVFLFLEEIRNAFSESVPIEQVFLVPGNHDVNRDKVVRGLFTELDSYATSDRISQMMRTQDSEWQTYVRRLEEYRHFLKSYYPHLLQDEGLLNYALTLEVRGIKIGVAGFNSAWSCGRDREKGKVWLGADYQAATLYRPLKDCDLRFALMHHPPSWLVPQEYRFANRVQDDFHFFLHGHEHDLHVRENAKGHCVVAAGAVHGDKSEESGYNFGAYDPASKTGEFRLRRFENVGLSWVPWVSQEYTDDHGVWKIGKTVDATLHIQPTRDLGEELLKASTPPKYTATKSAAQGERPTLSSEVIMPSRYEEDKAPPIKINRHMLSALLLLTLVATACYTLFTIYIVVSKKSNATAEPKINQVKTQTPAAGNVKEPNQTTVDSNAHEEPVSLLDEQKEVVKPEAIQNSSSKPLQHMEIISSNPRPTQKFECYNGDIGAFVVESEARFKYQNKPYTIALLLVCEEGTIDDFLRKHKCDDVYVLPKTYKDRSCRLLCWGSYATSDEARANQEKVKVYLNMHTWVINAKMYL